MNIDHGLNEEHLEMEKNFMFHATEPKNPVYNKNAKNNPLINCIIRGLWTYYPSWCKIQSVPNGGI